jgi:hypothetical protein
MRIGDCEHFFSRLMRMAIDFALRNGAINRTPSAGASRYMEQGNIFLLLKEVLLSNRRFLGNDWDEIYSLSASIDPVGFIEGSEPPASLPDFAPRPSE